MKTGFTTMMYRGIKYTSDSIVEMKKKFHSKELNYRGVRYIDNAIAKNATSFSTRKCYRGICY